MNISWKKVLPVSLFILFLISVIVPSQLPFNPRIVTFFLALILAIFIATEIPRLKWNSIFLLLFIFTTYQYTRDKGYHFGSDDSFYYSYVSSIVIDQDLDLSNQYELSGLPQEFFDKRTTTGQVENVFPIGASFLWLPFFLIGHFCVWILNLLGQTIPMNGYSQAYLNAVILGTISYAFLGLYCCFRFLCIYFSEYVASVSTVALWWTTPIYVYSTRVFLVSETVAMFAVCMLIFLARKFEVKLTNQRVLLLGLAGGLAAMIRFHNAIFLIIPAFLILQNRSYKQLGILIGGAIIAFLPQLFVWKIQFGEWIVNIPEQFFIWWKSPFVLETLFSARKGLFPWSPIIFLAFVGLFLFITKDKRWGLLFLGLFVVNVYINASTKGWWADTAFGARRFTNCFILFAAGFAAFYYTISRRFKWKGHLIVILIISALINMNFFLTRAYRRGRLSYEHADRFRDVLRGKLYPLYNFIVYPMEFPVQLWYWAHYRIPFYGSENEFFIGEDILYFQSKHKSLLEIPKNPLFGKGWQKGDDLQITEGSECILNIPMFFKYDDDVIVKMTLSPSHDERDVWADFYLNDQFLKKQKIFAGGKDITLLLSHNQYLRKVNLLKFKIYRKRNPHINPPQLELTRLRFKLAK